MSTIARPTAPSCARRATGSTTGSRRPKRPASSSCRRVPPSGVARAPIEACGRRAGDESHACRFRDRWFVACMSATANESREGSSMGRIIATEFISLDGVVEAPGPGEAFEYAGWSFEINRGDEGNKFKGDEAFEAEALLLGHKTYEGFADAWPSREGEFADKFNRMPKYVISSTLATAEWSNTTVLRGNLANEVGRVRERHSGPIVVHGSPTLVQGLLEQDLLDELRLMVYPVVL